MISGAKFTKLVRRDQGDEMYNANARIADSQNPEKHQNPEKPRSENPSEITTNHKRILKEFGDIFLDGLPPGNPPPRKVRHEIPNLPPPFKGIFRLSQAELQ
jgi:hypothetical protein